MKHKLTYTDNYILILSDEGFMKGKTFITNEGIIHSNYGYNYGDKVVIAHLPLNGAPYLEGVDVLPQIENEVEKLASIFAKENSIYPTAQDDTEYGFIHGYKKAKETYKYTEEDMIKTIEKSRVFYKLREDDGYDEFMHTPQEIIKSLNQPKLPIAFECEMIELLSSNKKYSVGICSVEIEQYVKKTITNSQGQTVWVGKYIFND